MSRNTENEEELVRRYENLLARDKMKVLCGSKSDAARSIELKILELKNIISRNKQVTKV